MGQGQHQCANVLITSVGRRNYLVDWFEQAGIVVGADVRAVTADGDPLAPAMGMGDGAVTLPRITSPSYADAVVETCREHRIDLLLSVNDYDIAAQSRSTVSRLKAMNVSVAIPPPDTLEIAENKLSTVEALRKAGINTPATATGEEFCGRRSAESIIRSSRYVVKHLYGSGSSGLFVVDGSLVPHAVALSAASAPAQDGARSGSPDASLVVVQEAIEGEEYGIDVVCDFDGAFHGVLARKKIRMRAGETDRAMTVDPEPFLDLGKGLADALRLCGNTDVDVIVRPDGQPVVIDINPRFGGGYPFSHLAGANVPACYLAWTLGVPIDPEWLIAEPGVTSSKYEAIRRVGTW